MQYIYPAGSDLLLFFFCSPSQDIRQIRATAFPTRVGIRQNGSNSISRCSFIDYLSTFFVLYAGRRLFISIEIFWIEKRKKKERRMRQYLILFNS
uniref:Uncharacterized protein n=1 Tax=Daphnia magna TaxID=35525 RepID=A0A0N8EHV9_9CRUS